MQRFVSINDAIQTRITAGKVYLFFIHVIKFIYQLFCFCFLSPHSTCIFSFPGGLTTTWNLQSTWKGLLSLSASIWTCLTLRGPCCLAQMRVLPQSGAWMAEGMLHAKFHSDSVLNPFTPLGLDCTVKKAWRRVIQSDASFVIGLLIVCGYKTHRKPRIFSRLKWRSKMIHCSKDISVQGKSSAFWEITKALMGVVVQQHGV